MHQSFVPRGVPTAVGAAVVNELRAGAVNLDASVMGPRRVLCAMLRYVPPDDDDDKTGVKEKEKEEVKAGHNAAWVRAHAAAAVGNLASHPHGVEGEACLRGTHRRALVDGEMFEVILSARHLGPFTSPTTSYTAAAAFTRRPFQ